MRIAAYPSVAHELYVTMVNLSLNVEQTKEGSWAGQFHRERPDLAGKMRTLWPSWNPIARPGAELLVMAALLGYLEETEPSRLLGDLPTWPERVLGLKRKPPLVDWFPDLVDMVADRLSALRQPACMEAYVHLVSQVWELIRPHWAPQGLASAQAEAALFRQRLEAGAPPGSLLPPDHIIHMDRFAPVWQACVERGPVVILPAYFGSGGHMWDMDGTLYVGYSMQAASLSQQQALRAGTVARRMKGFADPTRLAILTYISQLPVTVSDLARILRVAQPTVSEHLRILREAELVQVKRIGNKAFYRADSDAVEVLLKQARNLIVR